MWILQKKIVLYTSFSIISSTYKIQSDSIYFEQFVTLEKY